MEIERKGIRCSYSVLVIILFAALAFVVDYAVIERKMNKCSCPDCSGNTVGESDILNYSYKDIAGYYTINFEFDSDQTDSDGASVFGRGCQPAVSEISEGDCHIQADCFFHDRASDQSLFGTRDDFGQG